MTHLESVIPITPASAKVSIIITACDEAEHVAETLTFLKQQTYPYIEIICINDRSKDDTGAIMESFAEEDSRIQVIHIHKLPSGWLGKNHAAAQGASLATGDWLLFIDADVHLGPHAVARALQHALSQQLDHLSALGHYRCSGFLYNIVHLIYQGHGLVIPLKPWLAKSKRSKKSMNLGVFCLIKKTVYQACGGHTIAPLECLEDCRLGERIKQKKYSQEVVWAQNDIAITWYPTLRQHIKGFKKNAFAYFHYRLTPVMLGIIAWYGLFVWPEIACFTTEGISLYVNMINTFILLLQYFVVARFFKIARFYAFFYPIGLMIYPSLMIFSVLHFFKNKGIYWRGTFYDAATLRNNRS